MFYFWSLGGQLQFSIQPKFQRRIGYKEFCWLLYRVQPSALILFTGLRNSKICWVTKPKLLFSTLFSLYRSAIFPRYLLIYHTLSTAQCLTEYIVNSTTVYSSLCDSTGLNSVWILTYFVYYSGFSPFM